MIRVLVDTDFILVLEVLNLRESILMYCPKD